MKPSVEIQAFVNDARQINEKRMLIKNAKECFVGKIVNNIEIKFDLYSVKDIDEAIKVLMWAKPCLMKKFRK